MNNTSTHTPHARLHCEGNCLEVQPHCDVLRRLTTVEHKLQTNGCAGHFLQESPISLYKSVESDCGNVGRTLLGLQPVVMTLLEEQCYQVSTTGGLGELPEPNIANRPSCSLADDEVFVSWVRHYDRSIVRYGAHVQLPWLIAQIALAYRDLEFVVATQSVSQARWIAGELRTWLPDALSHVRPGYFADNQKQINIGNYEALLGGCGDLNFRQLLIAIDAIDVLGKRGMQLVGAMRNARMIGLLPIDQQPARRDEDQMRGLFGFSEVVIPDHGRKPLSVEVSHTTITGGIGLPADLAGAGLYRRALSNNDLLNRRVARLGREQSRTLRTVILVRNVEHAVSLVQRLPGWRIEAGDVNTVGMKAADEEVLATAINASGANIPTIVTLAAIAQIDPRRLDVLIRADAGKDLPPFPTNMLSQPANHIHRLCLIDLVDKRHHELGRATRSRRRAYRQANWCPPGTDPTQERVKEFLAARPTARRN